MSGKTQKDVESKLSLTKGTLTHWENGRRYPPEKYLKELSELYECDVDDLFDVDFREIMSLGRARLRQYLLAPTVDKEAERARVIVSLVNSHRNDEGTQRSHAVRKRLDNRFRSYPSL